MSVRREVVTLSQLLRRNENSNSRGAGRALPLPLQCSAGSRRAARQSTPASTTERPAPRYQPLTATERVRDANRASTSRAEVGTSSQTSAVLSQEVYDPDSELLSAMTSMSQSSFSQSQSQNLLGSSQDDQMHRFQQWQTQQTQLPPPLSPTGCSSHKKFQKLEENLTKALAEQACEQQQQQKTMLARFASPIKKSVKDIEARLTTDTEEYQGQRAIIKELADDVKSVATTVTDLYEQSLANKIVCEENCKTAAGEAEAVKAALLDLQARVVAVEGGVKSCSDLATRVLKREGLKHEALLSAVEASSCHCPQDGQLAQLRENTGRIAKKRRCSPRRRNSPEEKAACHTPASSGDGSPRRTRARSMLQFEIGSQSWREMDDIAAGTEGLHDALQRIRALRAKRRSYLHEL